MILLKSLKSGRKKRKSNTFTVLTELMPRAIMPSGRMIGLKEKTNSIHTALMRVLCIIISANINDIYNHYQAKTSLH